MDSQPGQTNHLEHMSMAMNVARDWALQALGLLLYVLGRWAVVTLQKFTWAVWGIERIRRDARRGLQFKQSAHVQEVLWRRKRHECSVADAHDFITKHKGFKHPSYVLRPGVSLYCLTRHEAVFVETEGEADVYSGGPLFSRQFQLARHVITVPLAAFHKTAQDLGPPRVPLTWLSCTPRSGSTLVAELLRSVPGVRLLNQPDALTCLAMLQRDGALGPGEYGQLVVSATRLLCKPDERCSELVLKARPCVTRMMGDVYPAFPQARYLYLYRNSLKSLHSSLAVMAGHPATRMLRVVLDSRLLSAVFPCARSWIYADVAAVNDKEGTALKPSSLSASGIATAAWASNVARCSELLDHGIPIRALLYEDLMRNTHAACRQIFKQLQLRAEFVSQAMQVFAKDFNRSPVLPYTDSRRALPHDARQEADMVLKRHGLPKLGERIELSGLIKFD